MSYPELPDDLIPELPDDLIREIAANTNYKDLLNMCKTSRLYYKTLCNDNYFWKLKTTYDFKPFYYIEPTTNVYGIADLYGDYGSDWYETYQYYRSVFSKEFIQALKADPPDADLIYNMIELIDEKGFLIVDETDDNGNTALMIASMKGYGDIVQFLLSEEGADPNLPDNNGRTALMWASEYGRTEIVRALLEGRASPDIQDNDRQTALMLASREGHTETVRALLEGQTFLFGSRSRT